MNKLLKFSVEDYIYDPRCKLLDSERNVLQYIAHRIRCKTKCWVKQSTIATDIHCTIRTVRSATKALEERGILSVGKIWKLKNYSINRSKLTYEIDNISIINIGQEMVSPEMVSPDHGKPFPVTIEVNHKEIDKELATASPASAFPSFIFNEENKTLAQSKGLCLETVYTKFKEWFGDKINRMKDVALKFRQWLINERDKIKSTVNNLTTGGIAMVPKQWAHEVLEEKDRERNKYSDESTKAKRQEAIEELREFRKKNAPLGFVPSVT